MNIRMWTGEKPKNIIWRKLKIYNGVIIMNKIINLNDFRNKKNLKTNKNKPQYSNNDSNKYIEAWDKLTSEEKIMMQEILEN